MASKKKRDGGGQYSQGYGKTQPPQVKGWGWNLGSGGDGHWLEKKGIFSPGTPDLVFRLCDLCCPCFSLFFIHNLPPHTIIQGSQYSPGASLV